MILILISNYSHLRFFQYLCFIIFHSSLEYNVGIPVLQYVNHPLFSESPHRNFPQNIPLFSPLFIPVCITPAFQTPCTDSTNRIGFACARHTRPSNTHRPPTTNTTPAAFTVRTQCFVCFRLRNLLLLLRVLFAFHLFSTIWRRISSVFLSVAFRVRESFPSRSLLEALVHCVQFFL